jgi:hypothetical protein
MSNRASSARQPRPVQLASIARTPARTHSKASPHELLSGDADSRAANQVLHRFLPGDNRRFGRAPRKAKKLGVPLLPIWGASAAFFTNTRSATTSFCRGKVAACKFRPSQNASDSLGLKWRSMNHWKAKLRSITEKLNSITPTDKPNRTFAVADIFRLFCPYFYY